MLACNAKHRGSSPKIFCRKNVLKNFAKFTGNHLEKQMTSGSNSSIY